jgi:hypothetical protein
VPFQYADMELPHSLRRWFLAHGVASVAAGLPLLIVPGLLLGSLGWRVVDPATARLSGAALLAIGALSVRVRREGVDVVRLVLGFVLLWSFAGMVALVIAVGQGAPPAVWAALSAFVAFAGVFTHYRIRFKQLAAADALDDGELESREDAEDAEDPRAVEGPRT